MSKSNQLRITAFCLFIPFLAACDGQLGESTVQFNGEGLVTQNETNQTTNDGSSDCELVPNETTVLTVCDGEIVSETEI